MKEQLRKSIADEFQNTVLGFARIKRNLGIENYTDSDTEELIRAIILSTPLKDVEAKGKNYYFNCLECNALLTVNAGTFTIITAKRIDRTRPVVRK